MLLHGSAPGVSAWANWRLTFPELAKQCRAVAPDLAQLHVFGRGGHWTQIAHSRRFDRLVTDCFGEGR